MVTLAAQSALAANEKIINVMRLVGARDSYIAQAFVRRFTLRAFWGAVLGAALGAGILALMPGVDGGGGFLTGLRLSGPSWAFLGVIPVITAFVAYLATRNAARRTLRALS